MKKIKKMFTYSLAQQKYFMKNLKTKVLKIQTSGTTMYEGVTQYRDTLLLFQPESTLVAAACC